MKRIDFPLLAVTVILSIFGLLMIYSASSFIAFRDFADKYHYVKDQSLWLMLGFLGLTFFSMFDYRKLSLFALPILLIAMALLVLVFIPGIGVYALGAHRWINLGLFVLQPAEVVKLSLAIYLAAWLSKKEKGRFPALIILILGIVALIMVEPDMGTASIVFIEALIVYFLSGAPVWHFGVIIPVVAIIGFILAKLSPYRAERLTSFFSSQASIDKTSYHVKQILIALGSGGVTGIGLGNSLQKYAYLPENTTDSIFAIIAEEFGFLGSSILIVLFMVLVWRGIKIARNVSDPFGRLLAAGIIAFLCSQAVVNLAAQTALVPLTGIPLPFISYGGSALVIDLCSIGILLNISKSHS